VYCPSANDLTVTWFADQAPTIVNQGWTTLGGGGVATKTAFNLNGGWVEYDFDVSGVTPGVNSNIYTISPKFSGGEYIPGDYCDGQGVDESGTGVNNQTKFCLEMDWIESNGNCGGATTWHTVPGPGYPGCTAWGCGAGYRYEGKSSFHMRIEYDEKGAFTAYRNGEMVGPYNPVPETKDWEIIRSIHEKEGSVIVSTQWEGWVPLDDCGSTGDLANSKFSVSNLKIGASVVQGPVPTLCSAAVSV